MRRSSFSTSTKADWKMPQASTMTIGRHMSDPGWRSEVYAYYGAEPYWEEIEGKETYRGGGGLYGL